MRCMNAYASGGYEFLAEQRDTKPSSVEEFLRDYIRLVDCAVEAGHAYGQELQWITQD